MNDCERIEELLSPLLDGELPPEETREVEAHLAGNASFQAPETLNLSLFHATRPGLDHEVVLRRSAAGTYLAARPELAQGRWYVQLDADGWRLKGEFEGTREARELRLGRAAGSAQ